ncbi:MAG: hypothetical protein AAF744_15575 [Pseudomonadota bacterium]
MKIIWSIAGNPLAGSALVTAGTMYPRCANTNIAPPGRDAAITSDAGLALLRQITGQR